MVHRASAVAEGVVWCGELVDSTDEDAELRVIAGKVAVNSEAVRVHES